MSELYLGGILNLPCNIFIISTSFLTTSRRLLHFSSPTGSAAAGTSEGASSPPSPREISSQSSSNLPSPVEASSKSGIQTWSLDTDLSFSRAATHTSVPFPSALQDNSSQDTLSSGRIPKFNEAIVKSKVMGRLSIDCKWFLGLWSCVFF